MLIKNAKLQPSGIEVACHADLLISYDNLVRENAELKRDSERFDFMIRKGYQIIDNSFHAHKPCFYVSSPTSYRQISDLCETPREAIDAAMRGEK